MDLRLPGIEDQPPWREDSPLSHLSDERDWYCIAEQPAPAPHLAHPEGRAALRIMLVTVPCVSRSCERFRMDLISPER